MKGKLPRRVVFHALFNGVMFFGALVACVLETVR